MDKVAIILQSFGLGDCIFAMGVAEHFRKQGYKILWPVKPWFVDGLNRAYPKVTFVPDTIIDPNIFLIKEDKVVDDLRIIPIRWSDSILSKPSKFWMRTKYDLYDLDYTTWKTFAEFRRDTVREHALMRGLDLKPGEKYNLINQTYKSDMKGNVPIKVENGLRNVEMSVLPGVSLFDWAGIIQNATNIHVVNSSIFYLLELLDLMAEEVHIYSRVEEDGFPYTDYLQTKKYILHQ